MRFEDALCLAGLLPREVVADGKLRRCATKTHPHRRNGWYLLHLDGKRGVYGDNAVAPRQALGHWTDEGATNYQPSAAEQARQQRAREQARKERIQAIRSARDYWARSRACTRLHPYLAAKGLSAFGTQGLRENDGMLVVPVWWNGSLISVQKIHPDGTKRFWPGAPVKAGCVVLERQPCGITAIVEGLATGLAVFQCVRQARVIVAFDAGNLLPVVQAVKPAGSVVLVADNDHGTQAKRGFNPGMEKARNAAELIGAGVAFFDGIEGTDAADALKQWGQQGARRIERLILKEARYVAGTV